jgi:hypothetical protein
MGSKTYDRVEFNRNASTVMKGLYLQVNVWRIGAEGGEGNNMAFDFQDGNAVELFVVPEYGSSVVSLGKGTYTIEGNIVRITIRQTRQTTIYTFLIAGSRFLAWKIGSDYAIFYHQ